MIIITGGAGFIGSNLVKRLNIEGVSDILIVDSLGKTDKWKNLINKNFLDFVHKSDFLEKLHSDSFANVKAIVHLGACSSTTEKDADYLISNNFHYSKELLLYALKHKIRFIYASSAATYGNGEQGYSDDDENTMKLRPLNMYGYSKQLMDEFVLKNNYQQKVVGLKFFNVFGTNEYHKKDMRSMVHKAYNQILTTGKVKLFKSDQPDFENGKQLRDFVYVKDCITVILWILNNSSINGIFNLGTGKAKTWLELANAVFSALNKKVNIDFIDMPDNLKGKYQNFTQAEMKKLFSRNFPYKFHTLQEAINDYVQNYLIKENPYY